MEQTTVLIPLSFYLLPSEDRDKDKGTNSIGARLNRMEDKVGFVQNLSKAFAILLWSLMFQSIILPFYIFSLYENKYFMFLLTIP